MVKKKPTKRKRVLNSIRISEDGPQPRERTQLLEDKTTVEDSQRLSISRNEINRLEGLAAPPAERRLQQLLDDESGIRSTTLHTMNSEDLIHYVDQTFYLKDIRKSEKSSAKDFSPSLESSENVNITDSPPPVSKFSRRTLASRKIYPQVFESALSTPDTNRMQATTKEPGKSTQSNEALVKSRINHLEDEASFRQLQEDEPTQESPVLSQAFKKRKKSRLDPALFKDAFKESLPSNKPEGHKEINTEDQDSDEKSAKLSSPNPRGVFRKQKKKKANPHIFTEALSSSEDEDSVEGTNQEKNLNHSALQDISDASTESPPQSKRPFSKKSNAKVQTVSAGFQEALEGDNVGTRTNMETIAASSLTPHHSSIKRKVDITFKNVDTYESSTDFPENISSNTSVTDKPFVEKVIRPWRQNKQRNLSLFQKALKSSANQNEGLVFPHKESNDGPSGGIRSETNAYTGSVLKERKRAGNESPSKLEESFKLSHEIMHNDRKVQNESNLSPQRKKLFAKKVKAKPDVGIFANVFEENSTLSNDHGNEDNSPQSKPQNDHDLQHESNLTPQRKKLFGKKGKAKPDVGIFANVFEENSTLSNDHGNEDNSPQSKPQNDHDLQHESNLTPQRKKLFGKKGKAKPDVGIFANVFEENSTLSNDHGNEDNSPQSKPQNDHDLQHESNLTPQRKKLFAKKVKAKPDVGIFANVFEENSTLSNDHGNEDNSPQSKPQNDHDLQHESNLTPQRKKLFAKKGKVKPDVGIFANVFEENSTLSNDHGNEDNSPQSKPQNDHDLQHESNLTPQRKKLFGKKGKAKPDVGIFANVFEENSTLSNDHGNEDNFPQSKPQNDHDLQHESNLTPQRKKLFGKKGKAKPDVGIFANVFEENSTLSNDHGNEDNSPQSKPQNDHDLQHESNLTPQRKNLFGKKGKAKPDVGIFANVFEENSTLSNDHSNEDNSPQSKPQNDHDLQHESNLIPQRKKLFAKKGKAKPDVGIFANVFEENSTLSNDHDNEDNSPQSKPQNDHDLQHESNLTPQRKKLFAKKGKTKPDVGIFANVFEENSTLSNDHGNEDNSPQSKPQNDNIVQNESNTTPQKSKHFTNKIKTRSEAGIFPNAFEEKGTAPNDLGNEDEPPHIDHDVQNESNSTTQRSKHFTKKEKSKSKTGIFANAFEESSTTSDVIDSEVASESKNTTNRSRLNKLVSEKSTVGSPHRSKPFTTKEKAKIDAGIFQGAFEGSDKESDSVENEVTTPSRKRISEHSNVATNEDLVQSSIYDSVAKKKKARVDATGFRADLEDSETKLGNGVSALSPPRADSFATREKTKHNSADLIQGKLSVTSEVPVSFQDGLERSSRVSNDISNKNEPPRFKPQIDHGAQNESSTTRQRSKHFARKEKSKSKTGIFANAFEESSTASDTSESKNTTNKSVPTKTVSERSSLHQSKPFAVKEKAKFGAGIFQGAFEGSDEESEIDGNEGTAPPKNKTSEHSNVAMNEDQIRCNVDTEKETRVNTSGFQANLEDSGTNLGKYVSTQTPSKAKPYATKGKTRHDSVDPLQRKLSVTPVVAVSFQDGFEGSNTASHVIENETITQNKNSHIPSKSKLNKSVALSSIAGVSHTSESSNRKEKGKSGEGNEITEDESVKSNRNSAFEHSDAGSRITENESHSDSNAVPHRPKSFTESEKTRVVTTTHGAFESSTDASEPVQVSDLSPKQQDSGENTEVVPGTSTSTPSSPRFPSLQNPDDKQKHPTQEEHSVAPVEAVSAHPNQEIERAELTKLQPHSSQDKFSNSAQQKQERIVKHLRDSFPSKENYSLRSSKETVKKHLSVDTSPTEASHLSSQPNLRMEEKKSESENSCPIKKHNLPLQIDFEAYINASRVTRLSAKAYQKTREKNLTGSGNSSPVRVKSRSENLVNITDSSLGRVSQVSPKSKKNVTARSVIGISDPSPTGITHSTAKKHAAEKTLQNELHEESSQSAKEHVQNVSRRLSFTVQDSGEISKVARFRKTKASADKSTVSLEGTPDISGNESFISTSKDMITAPPLNVTESQGEKLSEVRNKSTSDIKKKTTTEGISDAQNTVNSVKKKSLANENWRKLHYPLSSIKKHTSNDDDDVQNNRQSDKQKNLTNESRKKLHSTQSTSSTDDSDAFENVSFVSATKGAITTQDLSRTSESKTRNTSKNVPDASRSSPRKTQLSRDTTKDTSWAQKNANATSAKREQMLMSHYIAKSNRSNTSGVRAKMTKNAIEDLNEGQVSESQPSKILEANISLPKKTSTSLRLSRSMAVIDRNKPAKTSNILESPTSISFIYNANTLPSTSRNISTSPRRKMHISRETAKPLSKTSTGADSGTAIKTQMSRGNNNMPDTSQMTSSRKGQTSISEYMVVTNKSGYQERNAFQAERHASNSKAPENSTLKTRGTLSTLRFSKSKPQVTQKQNMQQTTVKHNRQQIQLPNRKVYRAKLKRPKPWASPNLYALIIKKCEEKFGELDARIRAEEFVIILCKLVSLVQKRKKVDNYVDTVHTIKKKLYRLGVIKSLMDFFIFIEKYLPGDFRYKVIECQMADGTQTGIPIPPGTDLYADLRLCNTYQ